MTSTSPRCRLALCRLGLGATHVVRWSGAADVRRVDHPGDRRSGPWRGDRGALEPTRDFAGPHPPYLKPEMFVPFWSYFYSRSLADLADVIGQVVIFMPLGAFWRRDSSGNRSMWSAS